MIEIPLPDDFHHHLRDGNEMRSVLPLVQAEFGRAIIMPNLKPPVRSVDDAGEYRDRILASLPEGSTFEPLMTIYLTDNTTPSDIVAAKGSGIVHAVKLYPSGATTNSEFGVTSMEKVSSTLAAMEDCGIPLLIHGEVTDPSVDVFDREPTFIDTVLKPLIAGHPHLRIVLEHITTEEAVDFILTCNNEDGTPKENIGATITAHHLLYNRNALFQGGLRPHMFCLPVLKRERHRQALLRAATGGDPRFFLGTDSAPHSSSVKESSCGCAGVFTAHAAIELYAEAFDSVGKIDALSDFAGTFGQRFYGLPPATRTVKLIREDWVVPKSYAFGDGEVRPLRAGEVIHWKKI